MPCGTLLQTGSYSMTSTRDAERHPYFFYSKTLVNTEKMLESTDFACTLKETKTTIPISRTPKPISGFGLKPGRYRPSAVKVAGFDPLDANHAASSTGGVASRPRQDVQTRKGKHWNERQPNDTAHANDRDGNGLRDREHAGRPGTGPIRNGSRHDHHTARCRRSKPGFRFTGWSLKKTPDKDETLLTPGKDTVSMPAEGEVAVYAQWEPAIVLREGTPSFRAVVNHAGLFWFSMYRFSVFNGAPPAVPA